jgi:DNA-entry nuclease
MEAQSVEDNGSGLQFNVYCYNVQDGVVIDYATGESCLAEDSTSVASASASAAINTASGTSSNASVQTTSNTKQTYILNTSSKKFHLESCSKVSNIKAKNKKTVQSTRADLILQNYSPCGVCNP